jgi:hypothetical protein
VALTKDSTLRLLTPEMLSALSPDKPAAPNQTPAAGPNQTKPNTDLQEMFDRLPAFTLAELKVGDAILVSGSKTADATRVTAIAVVSGVGPLLQSSQGDRRKAVALGAMTLGGP